MIQVDDRTNHRRYANEEQSFHTSLASSRFDFLAARPTGMSIYNPSVVTASNDKCLKINRKRNIMKQQPTVQNQNLLRRSAPDLHLFVG